MTLKDWGYRVSNFLASTVILVAISLPLSMYGMPPPAVESRLCLAVTLRPSSFYRHRVYVLEL